MEQPLANEVVKGLFHVKELDVEKHFVIEVFVRQVNELFFLQKISKFLVEAGCSSVFKNFQFHLFLIGS